MGGRSIGAVTIIAITEPAQRRIARYAGLVLLVTMGALVIAVLAFSQAALARRAGQLSDVNSRLQTEMAERQKTEEALRQSHKMEAVGQLSGGIAHDFNNLIMIAKSNLRMLQKKTAQGGGQTAHYVVSADEALDRAAGLTQRILAFSRRQPLSPQSMRLSDLVAGIAELIRHSAGDNVIIQTDLKARWLDPVRRQPDGECHPQPGDQCARRHAERRHADHRNPGRDPENTTCGMWPSSCRGTILR